MCSSDLFCFASKKYHPINDLNALVWKKYKIETKYYTTKLHEGAFALPAYVEAMLREVEENSPTNHLTTIEDLKERRASGL